LDILLIFLLLKAYGKQFNQINYPFLSTYE